MASYRLREKMRPHYQLGLDHAQQPLYDGKGQGDETHRVPSPCVIPKVQSPAVSGAAATRVSAAAGAMGLSPVSSVCFWKLKYFSFQNMTGEGALLRAEIGAKIYSWQ